MQILRSFGERILGNVADLVSRMQLYQSTIPEAYRYLHVRDQFQTDRPYSCYVFDAEELCVDTTRLTVMPKGTYVVLEEPTGWRKVRYIDGDAIQYTKDCDIGLYQRVDQPDNQVYCLVDPAMSM